VKDNRIKIGVIVLVLVLAVELLFSYVPSLYETLYFNSLFQLIRVVHDYSLGLLPIPSIYIVLIGFLWYFFRDVRATILSWLSAVLRFIIWVIIFFYVGWGYNYNQENLSTSLSLEVPSIDSTYISQAFLQQTDRLYAIKDSMTGIQSQFYFIENGIRDLQESVLDEWGWPTYGRVRVRYLWPGLLLHFRTSGIYIPHAAEGHIDAGLYVKQHPFTIAHEMSHGYGITDESEANFVAYLTCIKSKNLDIVYSAELAYWRYLARYYKAFHPESWTEFYNGLDARLIQDLNLINDHIKMYKDWMPKYRDVIYDNYLKSHGVKAGIKSYDQMILLIAAYKNKNAAEIEE
jgi:hypothetical protein